MTDLRAVFLREWAILARSDRGIFAVYLVLVLLWSLLFFSTGISAESPATLTTWILALSVIVGSNFSQSSFVSERLTGAFEILLVSGASRRALVWGKILFVTAMTLVLGVLTMGCAFFWGSFAGPSAKGFSLSGVDLALFFAVSLMNGASSAWLAVYLPNPRLIHFANFLFTGLAAALYFMVAAVRPACAPAVPLLLALAGIFWGESAVRAYRTERVLAPPSR